MVSVAYGGASDLSPIRPGVIRDSADQANWSLIERLFCTMKSINAVVSIIGLCVLLVLGCFSLAPVLENFEGARAIWLAFYVFCFGQFINQLFRHYTITLRGLNQVALTSRWDILFSILSSAFGAVAIIAGGGIFELACVIQIFVVLNLLRQWLLLTNVVEPRFQRMKAWSVDSQIMKWSWEPVGKGLVQCLANRGGSKMSVLVLARCMDPGLLGGVLLTVRMLDVVDDLASTALSCHIPNLGRLLGAEKLTEFRQVLVRKFRMMSGVQVLGLCCLGLFANYFLALIDSNVKMVDPSLFWILACSHFFVSAIRQSLMISAAGNNIVCVARFVVAAFCSIILARYFIPLSPFLGFVIAAYCPVIFIVNTQPLIQGCALMQERPLSFFTQTMLLPWLALLLVLCVHITYLTYQ